MIPTIISTSDQSNVHSIPSFRATFGANGEMMANASSGIVVKKPAKLYEMPKPSRINGVTGPTLVNGVRNVVANKIMAVTNNKTGMLNDIFLLV